MKRIFLLLALLGTTASAQPTSGQAYLERFLAYSEWSQNLPQQASPEFIQFIRDNSPLARKLREKWLYQLVRQKDWANFSKYYQVSADINLQCFAQLANYYEGRKDEAFQAAKQLWLSVSSQPAACNTLFNLMVKSPGFDEQLINQRIILALGRGNIGLARYLLKQYKQPRRKDEQLLASLAQRPTRLNQIGPGELHDYFYLYALKRMVTINMDQALKHWQDAQTKGLLNENQQQAFLVHLALYKAIRNHEDAPLWFAKIKPSFYTDVLVDWQIRFALKRQQWQQVAQLVSQSPDKDKPCWQYWLARAWEAQGDTVKAKELYESIAKNRNYYGFLASMHLNKTPSFENEPPIKNMAILKPYQAFTDNIKLLYSSKQTLQASRLLNDFVSELPKEDKSALLYWLANDLQWHDKSVYLSNSEELNNQLSLRFPLIYENSIKTYTKNYHISPEIIYAIIRQESGFRYDVVSPAGARGLMQVMPYTASVVAKKERIAYSDKEQLFLSDKNINIGVAYLKQLTSRYNQHPVLVAAAYNAGPSQVNYWLKNHPPKEMDIWIDTLPWHETRNYLKNIIAFYAVYQYRLQQKPNLESFMKPL